MASSGKILSLKFAIHVRDNKAYRAVRNLYISCMLVSEFL